MTHDYAELDIGKRVCRWLLAGSLGAAMITISLACNGGTQPVAQPTTKSMASQSAAASVAPTSAPAPALATSATAASTPITAAKELTGAGATFPYPLYSKWFDVYSQKTGVKINYQAVGSGAGIQQLTAKTVDFGASDAPMTDGQLKAAPGVLHIPTVAGPVAISYNLPGVDTGLRLSPDVLVGIFMGEIKKWNDPKLAALNPNMRLPDLAIAVVHRSDGSGTTNIFTDYLSAVSADWKSKIGKGTSVNWPVGLGGQGNPGVAGLVKQTPGAIGYVELAYVIQNKLPYALIQNQAGKFVEPSLDSTTEAMAGAVSKMPEDLRVSIVNAPGDKSYPISGFTYILVYQEQPDAAKGKALVDFLWWGIHDGEQYAKDLLYPPLPKEVVAKAEGKIKSITFQGKPLFSGS